MLSLERVKQHLRVELDFTEEDGLIQAYADAAVSAFETWTNRVLVDEINENTPANALVMTASIAQGALLLIGQWYVHRESVAYGVPVELPLATSALWRPHRWANI